MTIAILSGGAANGLVSALEDRIRAAAGMGTAGDYGAVGGMRDRILGGEPVDLIILTRAIVEALAESGHADPATITDLGEVRTGIALREGDPAAEVGTPEALAAALSGADALYTPDTEKATAGIHFHKVLGELGIRDAVADRLRTFPNGQTAMAAMAAGSDRRPVGCTQKTEIVNTPGVTYAGDLPGALGLGTVYTAVVSAGAAHPEAARAAIAVLADPAHAAVRLEKGFSG